MAALSSAHNKVPSMRTRTLLGLSLLLCAGCAGPSNGGSSSTTNEAVKPLTKMTLDQVLWSDDPRLPEYVLKSLEGRLSLIGHVKSWHGFPAMKQFTKDADPLFVLSQQGQDPVSVRASTGGITSSDGKLRYVLLYCRGARSVDQSVAYDLRPLNQEPGFQWKVECQVEPKAVLAGL